MHGHRKWITAAVAFAGTIVFLPSDSLADYTVYLRSETLNPPATTEASEAYLQRMPEQVGRVLMQPYSRKDRAVLERAGVEFLAYVPDDTWIVRAPAKVFEEPATSSRIRWSAPLKVVDRLESSVLDMADGVAAPVRIRFHDDVSIESVLPVLESMGVSVRRVSEVFRSVEALAQRDALLQVGSLDEVLWVSPSVTPEATNNGVREGTRAAEIFDPPYGLDGSGVVVAQWDAGIPNSHLDLNGRVFPQEVTNEGGHATLVAGVLIGDGTNSVAHGGAPLQWMGVAPEAHLLSWDYCGTGVYDEPFPPCDANLVLLEQHEDALLLGANISNNSWNAAISDAYGNCNWLGDYAILAPDYDEVAAGIYGEEMTIVFAAGNRREADFCGFSAGEPNYGVVPPPATAKNTISVGSVFSDTGSMTRFSSWGPTDDGRLKPEIVAPGAQLFGDEGVTTTFAASPVDGYRAVQGTSFSAPALSGCIALLQQSYTDQYGSDLPPSLTRALLFNTAEDISVEGPDYTTGFGAIDIRAAVDQSEAGAFVAGSVSDGGTQTHTFSVSSTQSEVKVTLAWTDPAGTPLAQKAIVNDLDLVLVDPQGTNHYPWILDKNAPEAPAGRGVNDVDVQEQVCVDAPDAGLWTAKVTGAVSEGSAQDYHLAIYDPAAESVCTGNVIQVPSEYATIQAAIDAANECDVIQVAAGHYSESLTVDKALTIEGAGASAQTILWPPSGQRAVTSTADLTISGFDIRFGQASGSGYDGFGGGIFSEAGGLVIRGCLITGGSASLAGGAIADLGGEFELTGCTVSGSSNLTAGAILIQNPSRARVENCFIINSSAGVSGGGLEVVDGTAEVVGNTFFGNQASLQGGAIHFSGTYGSLYVANNIVAGNSSGTGGGVHSSQGGLTLECNDFFDNSGGDYGGMAGAGATDFFQDPLFCSSANGNFKIRNNSPCAPGQSPSGCGLVGAGQVGCLSISLNMEGIEEEEDGVPSVFFAGAVRPNPMIGTSTLEFGLPERSGVRVEVYDASGRRIASVLEVDLDAGTHTVSWNGKDDLNQPVASGVYFMKLEAGSQSSTRKVTLVRN